MKQLINSLEWHKSHLPYAESKKFKEHQDAISAAVDLIMNNEEDAKIGITTFFALEIPLIYLFEEIADRCEKLLSYAFYEARKDKNKYSCYIRNYYATKSIFIGDRYHLTFDSRDHRIERITTKLIPYNFDISTYSKWAKGFDLPPIVDTKYKTDKHPETYPNGKHYGGSFKNCQFLRNNITEEVIEYFTSILNNNPYG